NCHLAGGTGQREGGVRSADITWFHLTKEHPGKRATGRVHPAYDEETVMAAITEGVDPAGNALDAAHPRYRMTREDLEDLVAYIKVMDREAVPGVTDNAVRVGILLPEKGPLAEAGREVQALLTGVFAEVNARGGLYSRSLSLVPVPFDPDGTDGALPAARNAVESDDVFCFLANVGGQADDRTARYLSTRGVPVIVPLLSAPEGGYGAGRYTFHVFASIRDQARVMTDFLAERLRRPANRVGILHAEDGSGRAGAEGAKEKPSRGFGEGTSTRSSISGDPGRPWRSPGRRTAGIGAPCSSPPPRGFADRPSSPPRSISPILPRGRWWNSPESGRNMPSAACTAPFSSWPTRARSSWKRD
ncbi:MAG: putative cytochrome c, partial [Deltaproteobacteria bacterium]|nr:putative cytochrome c [Deltaproteobacteria bacterium]